MTRPREPPQIPQRCVTCGAEDGVSECHLCEKLCCADCVPIKDHECVVDGWRIT